MDQSVVSEILCVTETITNKTKQNKCSGVLKYSLGIVNSALGHQAVIPLVHHDEGEDRKPQENKG